ncbi:MAG: HlyC/CorC family transporter [Caldilineaceae bacterium]|nr:HlyC/CorC family transporter [Caldilineaceae bacterium]
MAEYFIPIAVITFLIIINGFFVAAEFAIAAAPRTRVAQMAEAGSVPAQRVLVILRTPDLLNRYISTAQVGITIASLGLGSYGEHAIAEWFIGPLEHLGWVGDALAHSAATVISVALLTYLHVVIGEMVPKTLALQSAAKAAVRLSPMMAMAELVFRPLTLILNWIGAAILRLAGLPEADAAAKLISSEELAYIVEESSVSGLLDPEEQLYLENVLDFHDRMVGQVMTPRTRMVALPINADFATNMRTVIEQPHSRYPVFAESRDDIVGILHVKDLARRVTLNEQEFDLRSILREPVFVPETLSLEDMLNEFRHRHIQVAVVVDEYGGTAGIVTLEDLAEELIGEIQDEFDHEIAPFSELDARTLRVRGDLLLDEITQHYDIDFDDVEAETVGGLIMEQLGHVAEPGERAEYQGLTFDVESIDGLAVETAIIGLPEEKGEETSAASTHDEATADAASEEAPDTPTT